MATELTLTRDERTALRHCEARIQRGIATFREVGSALLAIREGKLYRETHKDFQAYCRERWQIDRSYAHRLMKAAEVAENVANCQQDPPQNEAVARELGKLPADEQPGAWSDARERFGDKPTAEQIRTIVDAYQADNEPYQEPQDHPVEAVDEESEPEPLDGEVVEEDEPTPPPADGLARRIFATVEAYSDDHPGMTGHAAAIILRGVADQIDDGE